MYTARSVMPLNFGHFGLDEICVNSHLAAKLAEALLEYCSPLSDTAVLGIPCLENIDFVCVITEEFAVFLKSAIFKKLEK